MESWDLLVDAVLNGDGISVESEVKKTLGEGANARDILVKGLIGGMRIVGERFGAGEMFLPEVIASANAMHSGLNIVKPLLVESGQEALGRVVIGTVAGDIHDIGKRIVGFLLEGNGYEVIDLGVDVPDEKFAQAVAEHKPDVLGMSALLTTTMPNMGSVINLLKEKGLREKIGIVVGGASVTGEFAKSIGADGFAPEARTGLEWVIKAIENSKGDK